MDNPFLVPSIVLGIMLSIFGTLYVVIPERIEAYGTVIQISPCGDRCTLKIKDDDGRVFYLTSRRGGIIGQRVELSCRDHEEGNRTCFLVN